jgi:hypothetical protein
LRCKGNWHKNKKSFQQTCISMNEMTTGCFSKKSAQSCNTCSLSVAMWDQWKCQFLQHHQTWRCDTSVIWDPAHANHDIQHKIC